MSRLSLRDLKPRPSTTPPRAGTKAFIITDADAPAEDVCGTEAIRTFKSEQKAAKRLAIPLRHEEVPSQSRVSMSHYLKLREPPLDRSVKLINYLADGISSKVHPP